MPPRCFLLALLLFLVPAYGYDQKPNPLATPAAPTAPSSLVLDLESGRVLEAKNAEQKMFPASTTKIMTCLVALEHGDLKQVIRAGKNAAQTGESGIYLLEGEQHTLADLVRAALIHSANDACVAIAEGLGGSQSQFVGWMNQKAKQLGCRNTHFVNPHGLHDPNHFTTASDLALISRAALQIPFFNRVVREKTATLNGNWKIGPTRVIVNRNKLLFRWAQCDGLKTGYTRQAGNCLVASATQAATRGAKPWRLLAVALHSAPGRSFGDCQRLLQRAFAGYERETVVKASEIVFEGRIKGGAFDLEAMPSRDLVLPLRAGERQTLSRRVEMLPLSAPVAKGRLVGHVNLFSSVSGAPQRLARWPLLARDAVPQSLLARAAGPVGARFPSLLNAALPLTLLGLGSAILLVSLRKYHVRRRSHSAFRSANLGARPRNHPGRPR
ncbi:MAG TPA: D-alanyl-D-alanine carboxypeptidase family protein [Abditibacterium sp.]|jgi:D-alanyl-D-alanine carboxypeptidase (penicillin-binding protein 5/6)